MAGAKKDIFKKLFFEYYNPLCNYAFYILENDLLAEDAVQEVFSKLWEDGKDIDSIQNLNAYLYTSVKNKCLEYLRRKELKSKYINEKIRQIETSPKDEMELWLWMDRITYSMRQLPPKCKQIFALSKLEGLTYAEIAAHLNISAKTVENQMSIAFKILKSELSKYRD